MTSQVGGDVALAPALLSAILAWPRGLDTPCFVSAERSLTAAEVLARVWRRTDHLKKVGVLPGDFVMLITGRGHQFWIDLLALWTIGAVAVPIEANPTSARLTAVIAKALPKWQLGSFLNLSDSRLRKIDDQLNSPGAVDLQGTLTTIHDTASRDLAIVLFTSGSTGEPKGVALSHRAALGNALATRDVIKLGSSDVLGAAIPFRFVSALSHFLVCILSGACYAGTDASLSHGEFIQYLLSVGCTAYGGSPLQARWIAEWLEHPAAIADPHNLKLRWIMSSGDHFSESVGQRLMQQLKGCTLVVAYGLTESAGRMCCRVVSSAADLRSGGTVGRPIEGLALDVFDDDMTRCPPGEPGKIFVKGAYLFEGYLNGHSMVRLTDGGWFETGDYGHKTLTGELVVRGRNDDVFKVAGVKVSAVMIADALLSSGKYADVAVVSRPHPRVGNVPYVYYAPLVGESFNLRETMRFLREQLPASHLPWGFSEVAVIPRTGSGKIDRRALQSVIDSRPTTSSTLTLS